MPPMKKKTTTTGGAKKDGEVFVDKLSTILSLYRDSNIIDPRATSVKIRNIATTVYKTLSHTKSNTTRRQYMQFILSELPKIRENPNMALVFETQNQTKIGNYLNSMMMLKSKTLKIKRKLKRTTASNIYEYTSQYKRGLLTDRVKLSASQISAIRSVLNVPPSNRALLMGLTHKQLLKFLLTKIVLMHGVKRSLVPKKEKNGTVQLIRPNKNRNGSSNQNRNGSSKSNQSRNGSSNQNRNGSSRSNQSRNGSSRSNQSRNGSSNQNKYTLNLPSVSRTDAQNLPPSAPSNTKAPVTYNNSNSKTPIEKDLPLQRSGNLPVFPNVELKQLDPKRPAPNFTSV